MASAKPGRWKVVLGCLVLLLVGGSGVLLALKGRSTPPEPETSKEQPDRLWGFSLSPQSFEAANYLAFFETAAAHGNTLSWAGHYQDLTKTSGNAAKTVIAEAKKRKMVPVIITGPNKGEVFDGIFVEGFRSAVLDFVKANDVPYLGLGNEIDQFYSESPARFSSLLTTVDQLVKDIRQASPNTRVFTVFQLERLKGLRGGLFGGVNDPNKNYWQLLDDLPDFDLVAFTTYPCLIYKSPAEIPEEYYSDIANQTSLPVSFTEIGWFRDTPATGWESDEQEQADFIARFGELTTRLEPKLVIWPFLYDQKIPAPFQAMGLLGAGQAESRGLTAWDLTQSENDGD